MCGKDIFIVPSPETCHGVKYVLATFVNVFATTKNDFATKNVARSFLSVARPFIPYLRPKPVMGCNMSLPHFRMYLPTQNMTLPQKVWESHFEG